MTTRKPPARYGAIGGARPGGFATAELHHSGDTTANCIMKLPKAKHDAEEWQAAMEALLVAESDGRRCSRR